MSQNVLPALCLSSRYYISQRLRLHFLDWGNESARPLVLVHGGQDHCRNWDWVASAFRNEYHVITPDLRGHGDSDWASDGQYSMCGFVYDLAQLVEQQQLAPVTLVGHSLGGSVCLRYAGIFPQKVAKIVVIEGLGYVPDAPYVPPEERVRKWIAHQRDLAAREPKRYLSLDAVVQRMREANPHLSAEQSNHLAIHGVRRNEDGTYSWKFDNYVRSAPPHDDVDDLPPLWARITCPVLLAYGTASWASSPADDGRLDYFAKGEVALFEGAGHWLHHDDADRFISVVRNFLHGEVFASA